MTLCLLDTLDASNTIRKLIVGDIAPVKYINWDIPTVVEAMKGIPLHSIKARSEADMHLEKGGVKDANVRQFILSNLVLKNAQYEWRCNLAAIEANLDDLADFPFSVHSTQNFKNPVLMMKGGKSQLVRDSHMPTIKHLFPMAKLVNFEQCDHWIHFQDPKRFIHEVVTFLDTE